MPYRTPAPKPAAPPPKKEKSFLTKWLDSFRTAGLRHCVNCPEAAVGGCVIECRAKKVQQVMP